MWRRGAGCATQVCARPRCCLYIASLACDKGQRTRACKGQSWRPAQSRVREYELHLWAGEVGAAHASWRVWLCGPLGEASRLKLFLCVRL